MGMVLREPQCVVSNMVTEGLNLLVSRPKLGKSWLALQLAIAVASGRFALGSRRTQSGDVLYIAMEDSYRRLQDRLRKLLGDKAPPERLDITNQWEPLDKGGAEEIVRWAEQVEKPQLVVIDTVERVRSPGTRRGNAYSDDYSYLAGVHEVLKETNISAVLGLHHDRKADSLDPLDVVNGSIGITAAVDSILLLKRDRGKDEAYLKVHSRDIDEQDYGLEWDSAKFGWTLVGSGPELRERRMSDERREVFECVKEHGPITLDQVVELLKKPERKNNIKQFLYQLVKKDDLQLNEGQYSLPALT
jgi:RecA-family ATPase